MLIFDFTELHTDQVPTEFDIGCVDDFAGQVEALSIRELNNHVDSRVLSQMPIDNEA